MVTSGLLTFALQWRTVLRAFRGLVGRHLARGLVFAAEETAEAALDAVEVPASWFLAGMLFATTGIVITGWWAFGINPFFGVIAVALSFILSVVAARATGETDTTPVGAMGKITQLTYGVLVPGNITTNLMTASITAGAATSSADLLTDLKSGYLLGANPRKQFIAQMWGTIVGTAVTVPCFYLLVPTADVLGGDKFPAPSAQVWSGVAQLLSKGVHELHWTARVGMIVGGLIGIALPLLEMKFPKKRHLIPSSMGVGLAFVIPCFNSISMFLGALLAWLWSRKNEKAADKYVVAVSSGLIAGESLMGVAIVLLGTVLGWLAQ
jgi:OPT family oligopeptide transporter